jgi:hypothetical protein
MNAPVDQSQMLPPELLEQLSRRHRNTGTTADRVRAALAASPGPHSIDDLLITIWRQTGHIEQRSAVQHCLSFLRRRGEAESTARGTWQQANPKGSSTCAS